MKRGGAALLRRARKLSSGDQAMFDASSPGALAKRQTEMDGLPRLEVLISVMTFIGRIPECDHIAGPYLSGKRGNSLHRELPLFLIQVKT